MNVKELIARLLYKWNYNLLVTKLPYRDVKEEYMVQAEAVLNLRYPHGKHECEWKDGYFVNDSGQICPTCKGTGQGKKVLAVVCENQELPTNLAKLVTDDEWDELDLLSIIELVVFRMTIPKDGTKWMKVEVKE